MIGFEIVLGCLVIGLSSVFTLWYLVEHALSTGSWFYDAPIPVALTEIELLSLFVRNVLVTFPGYLVIIYFMIRSGKPWAEYGLVRPATWEEMASNWFQGLGWAILGLLIYVGFMQSFLIPLLQFGSFRTTIEWPNLVRFWGERSILEYALMLVIAILVGTSEELFYRGYLIPRLLHLGFSPKWSLLVSSIVFALAHTYQGLGGVLSTFLLGVIFGGIFLRTRRLWPLMIAHALLDFASI